MIEVRMPRLSDSMEEGTIVRWLKADGDEVSRGEEIVEIETDKATMAFEADGDGMLAILAPDGDTRRVGEVIARIAAPGATPKQNGASADEDAPPARLEPPPAVEAAQPPARDVGARARPRRDGVDASPVGRRLAARLGVDLTRVRGSGPRGRILKADVARSARETPRKETATPPAAPLAAAPLTGRGEPVVEELSRVQATVARRMAESKATTPDFWTSADVDMSAILQLRTQLKRVVDPVPSINDVLVKLCAMALRRHPRVNGAYRDGRFERYERVNVGIAVAAEDALLVPTIFDADLLTLGAIAAETRRLAERVRTREIAPPELAGGTFTVSNLGMLGVDRFGGVINPPQAAILCAGAVMARPAVDDSGAIVARPTMSLTLVSDHRILYGADSARFLAELRDLLQAPLAAVL
jgi:pyruvate dehydrogenase E2 component (dihydrolipoamide acetyltransferase)